jgi:glyoxylase-like metal-dependent hydrolase (beta-lactamase superfamily II)
MVYLCDRIFSWRTVKNYPSETYVSTSFIRSGDTVFPGGPGKTESPGDLRQIIESINGKVFVLPDATEIYPGHGDPTIVRKEKRELAIFSSRSHDPNLFGDVLWLSS